MIRVRLPVVTTPAPSTRVLLVLKVFLANVRFRLSGPLSSSRLGWMSEPWLREYRASHR